MVGCWEKIARNQGSSVLSSRIIWLFAVASMMASCSAAAAFDASGTLAQLRDPKSSLLAPVAAFQALPVIDTATANAAMATFKSLVDSYASVGSAAPAGSQLATAYTAATTYISSNSAILAAPVDITAEISKLNSALGILQNALTSSVSSSATSAITAAQATAQASIDAVVQKIQDATAKLAAARAVFDQISQQATQASISVPQMPWAATNPAPGASAATSVTTSAPAPSRS